LYRKWFTPWIVEVYQDGELIYEFDFEKSLRRGKVCISIDSASLGDTLAWVPVAEEFRRKYDCDLYVDSFWSELLCQYYPEIRFHHSGYREPGTNAVFGLGWYEETDRNTHRRDPRTISLQQVAGDILGLDIPSDVLFHHIPETVYKSTPLIEGKYVCIAMDSTANAKHWHYPDGWQILVDHLNSQGYQVVVIQKQGTSLKGVIDKTGNFDILERAVDIYHSQFLIGIGSGLSWLAWSLSKPVIMISGFSDPKCEFSTKNYRIINKNVCNGCFNDPAHKFDRGDWNWCPRLKDTERRFECTTSITPEMVFDAIKSIEQKELS
jgi:autotransporter strand-loop-strand O-heptosyltransferase